MNRALVVSRGGKIGGVMICDDNRVDNYFRQIKTADFDDTLKVEEFHVSSLGELIAFAEGS